MPHAIDADDDVELLVPEEEMVPEHDRHRVLVDLLAAGIVARFADHDDVAVFCRLAWFPDAADTRIRLDPDVMVVFGRPPGPRKSYKAWREEHVAPAVLVEVWSDDDTDADYRRRLGRARRYGVEEVVIVDPFAVGGVRVEHLRGDGEGWRPVAVSTSPDNPIAVDALGIRLAGGDDLRVTEAGSDEPWPTTAEAFRAARAEHARADAERARADAEHARADAERARADAEQARADAEHDRADAEQARADAERARADAEQARADAEHARADRLAEQLRRAGIDPDG